ncbi:hypothetical protein [Blastococcus sp. SYSU DS1021]
MALDTASDELLDGPSWSRPGLDVAAGRYPLSVERHVMRMVDHLVPGVTAVTPHGRYYALHGLIAAEAEKRDLTVPAAQDLLRRAEVTLATVSFAHHSQADIGWLPRAHGVDALARRLQTGTVELDDASRHGGNGYVQSVWGFWGPYAGSETTLGILTPGPRPAPGPRLDVAAVQEGLGDILQLAAQDSLHVADLTAVAERLCVCRGGDQPDGRWLARLMCADGANREPDSRAEARRQTVRLLARIVSTHEVTSFTRDVGEVLAFGRFLTDDPVTSGVDTAAVWRGVVLRNYAVGAWRRLWSWLVSQVDGFMAAEDLAERFVAELPPGTVQAFLDSLPATRDGDGFPIPAEAALRTSGDPLPLAELRVLAASARRVDELEGRVRDAFLGQRGIELGPEWVSRRLDEAKPQQLADFARRLTFDLLARSQRVALSKARRRSDGSLWLPTRLHERGGFLFRTSQEGRGDVGLRLDQLGSVLASAGVLQFDDEAARWAVTPPGQVLVG